MKKQENIKDQLWQQLQKQIDQQITLLEADIRSTENDRNKETKSSVGDKYETGRAMMQQEIFRKKEQLQQALETRLVLSTIKPTLLHSQVQLGSLVKTNRGYFYLSVGLGKVKMGNELYFAISNHSPIGVVLLGKKEGEVLEFRGKKIQIETIL